MTGQNRKSYKKDADFYKRRCEELEEKIKQLQSPKSPSVADENSKLENAKNSNGNNGVVKLEKSPSSEPKGQIVPNNQKVPLQAPQEQKNTLQIEEPEEPEPAETPEPKEKPEEFTFECPECNKQFNELNEGCCPFCNAELEENEE